MVVTEQLTTVNVAQKSPVVVSSDIVQHLYVVLVCRAGCTTGRRVLIRSIKLENACGEATRCTIEEKHVQRVKKQNSIVHR